MKTGNVCKRLITIGITGAMSLILPACAGHKELKAPCSASAVPLRFWSAPAYAGSDCGPMHEVNPQISIDGQFVPDFPVPGYEEN